MAVGQRLRWLERDVLGDFNALKLGRIASGQDVFDLAMINPDIQPPRFLLDKLLEASVRPANHRYAVARGIRKLREAFAEKYKSAWGVPLDPEKEICVTMGSKDALEHALMGLASDGDSVLVGTPTYPNYLSSIQLARLTPIFFQIQEDESRMLAQIESECKRAKPKILLLNFPNNPTGFAVSRDFYVKLELVAKAYDVFILNDFVYGEMKFSEPRAVSLLEVPGMKLRAAEMYSISKAYSVPGWRVGAMVGNVDLVRMLSHLKAHIDYGIFLPIQHAATAALTQGAEIPRGITVQYEERCTVLAAGLKKLGWDIKVPQAGCCVWARVPEALRSRGSLEVARELLQSTGVVGLPGVAFADPNFAGSRDSNGDNGFHEWIRFALVAPVAKVRSVVDKIGLWQRECKVLPTQKPQREGMVCP